MVVGAEAAMLVKSAHEEAQALVACYQQMERMLEKPALDVDDNMPPQASGVLGMAEPPLDLPHCCVWLWQRLICGMLWWIWHFSVWTVRLFLQPVVRYVSTITSWVRAMLRWLLRLIIFLVCFRAAAGLLALLAHGGQHLMYWVTCYATREERRGVAHAMSGKAVDILCTSINWANQCLQTLAQAAGMHARRLASIERHVRDANNLILELVLLTRAFLGWTMRLAAVGVWSAAGIAVGLLQLRFPDIAQSEY